MAANRSRSQLPAAALAVAACLLAAAWACGCFVAGPAREASSQLRGAPAGAAAAAAAAALATPLAAVAEDKLVDYNMAGEFTQFFVVGYFGLTTAFTAFAFFSYLILTKLKII
eukprot:CAMPEP_0204597790 /NCGR_PEP_ID=MMETSP0661-20131031/53986_1 /ASSEMBLY_ACC=CAM_ASM_000606 /TAXON_ID=109239 /ORGANISM="Alexandrium margalefi, Strain AMGDE01CS-322" /LENGTH=112 /DNA_ID=CAMNT_0051608489 /DNA_START=78 /DNA_END=416 /DNA_ORIENTATION=-